MVSSNFRSIMHWMDLSLNWEKNNSRRDLKRTPILSRCWNDSIVLLLFSHIWTLLLSSMFSYCIPKLPVQYGTTCLFSDLMWPSFSGRVEWNKPASSNDCVSSQCCLHLNMNKVWSSSILSTVVFQSHHECVREIWSRTYFFGAIASCPVSIWKHLPFL